MPLLTLVAASAQACDGPDAAGRNPRQDGGGRTPAASEYRNLPYPYRTVGRGRSGVPVGETMNSRTVVPSADSYVTSCGANIGNVDRSGRCRVELHLAGAGVEGVNRRYLRVIGVGEPDDGSTGWLLDGSGDGSGAPVVRPR